MLSSEIKKKTLKIVWFKAHIKQLLILFAYNLICRFPGSMLACASVVFAGTMKTTGATP